MLRRYLIDAGTEVHGFHLKKYSSTGHILKTLLFRRLHHLKALESFCYEDKQLGINLQYDEIIKNKPTMESS